MKYIDADRIRAEIERRMKHWHCFEFMDEMLKGPNGDDGFLSFLDTLEDPEPPTMGYDEAYLNEKIAKASKSWEGVDVDKFMDEVRGREPVSDDLEEEVKRYYSENFSYITSDNPTLSILTNIARHFAEWMKAKMMEGAVEGEVCGRVYDHLNIRFADGVCKYLEPKNISHIPADVSKYNIGDKVKIIVVKEDKK